jgi:MFS transporter, LPLT family, lysophospholipid transporter
VNRALLGGLLLGPVILALGFVHQLEVAYVLMVVIGICGGMFVVPLNALLQERGHESIGAGKALAVQNFVENIAMLLLVGGYTLAISLGVEVTNVPIGFGVFLMVSLLAIAGVRKNQTINEYS